MHMLLLQTFLLLLAAFLLGATTSCLLKRSLYRFDEVEEDDSEVARVRIGNEVVQREVTPVPVSVVPGPANADDTARFGRALRGDVTDVAAEVHAAAARGPMIEVQPMPAPVLKAPAPTPVAAVVPVPAPEIPAPAARIFIPASVAIPEKPGQDLRTYTEIAVASHDGSTLGPATIVTAVLAPPKMPGPAPAALPVPLIEVPRFARPADAPLDPEISYVATALAATGGYVPKPEPEPVAPSFPPYVYPPSEEEVAYPQGQSYAQIAVASHDGSTLPLETVRSVVLPPPQMPGPAPAVLEVPRIKVPPSVRPDDAPPDPVMSYAAAALAANGEYVPQESDFVRSADVEFTPYDETKAVPELPEGGSYAAVATGASDAGADTGSTLATAAVAASAAIAAARAASSSDDDLMQIVDIDDMSASRLRYNGVTRFAQIARWSDSDIAYFSQALGLFGKIQDEDWVGQAKRLSKGDATAEAGDVPPPAAPTRATAYGAADTATAAAAAAAAAMVASAAAAKKPREAEREAQHVAAKTADASVSGEALPDSGLGRSDLTGLRSVRSEALLGDVDFVRGNLDDLKRIRGIGVLIEKKLNSLGVTGYEQIANWSGADVDRISDVLDFKGRIERENWVEQARILASGGQTEFSRRVDKGEA